MYQKFKSAQLSAAAEAVEEGADIKSPPMLSESDKNIVEKCWGQIDAEEEKYKDWHPPPPQAPGVLGWRTVRIFVSSTFSDFFNERELLVKKVFPELREWGSERKIRVIDCDLRWGVPHDSTTGETIAVCMEELDYCHETNEGEPFFLNLMGERYGWIPSVDENTDEVREKYDWINGTSITFMEILHGAYRRRNPNAVFFLRNSDFLSLVPEDHITKFTESEPLGQHHLKVLKARLRERFPDRVMEYQVQMAGMSNTTGTEKVQLTIQDDFAVCCLDFFKSAIARKYPQQQTVTILSAEEQEQELQRIFIVEKAELVIGRDEEVQRLLGYINDPQSCDLEKHHPGEEPTLREGKLWSNSQGDNLICVVQARSGWGKTSLLAHLVLTAIKQGHSIFYHFSGSTSQSRRTTDMVVRLLEALNIDEQLTEEDREGFRTSLEKQQQLLDKNLDKFRHSQRQLTIIIDAVNELDLSSMVDHLSWLPPFVPPNVKVIVSCNEHPPSLARLRDHPCYWMTVGELGESHMRSIAISFLGRYNKRLDKGQLEALTHETKVNSPLWMTLICEELRVFGDFRTVTQKIRSLPDTLDGLFGDIFTRLLAEDDTGNIRKALCLIASSWSGMPTQDILKLLGDVTNKQEAAPISWALARRHLKPYLRISGFPDECVTFSHEKIWKAVKEHVITSHEERRKWQLHLADFYQFWSTNSNLKSSLLPELLRSTDQKDRLVRFMREDRDSWKIGQFRRSDLLRWCRCRRPTHGSFSSTPVMICTFCSLKRNCFSPGNMRPCKESCVICGAFCFPSNKNKASLCTFHAKSTPNTSRCVVCSRVMFIKTKGHGDVEGRLCHQCGFGNHGMMCSYVGAM